MSKYRVFSGPNTGKYGPKKTTYLDTFHAMYDENFMKIKFNSDDELPLNKAIEIPSMIIVVRAVFHKNNKYYQQVFFDGCLYKLQT